MKKAEKRTARRVNEQPRAPLAPAPNSDAPAAAPPAPVVDDARDEKKGGKLALMFEGDRFLVDRMERSTLERFRQMARNTPELFGSGEGSDVAFDLDLDAWIAQAYGLLFGGAAILLVRSGRLHEQQVVAFQNPERIKKLVPQTERAIDEQFGAKLRNLPPLVQLGLSVVGAFGAMYQDAAQLDIVDERAGPRAVAPGQQVRP